MMVKILLVLLFSAGCLAFDWDEETPLDEYVWRDMTDDAYNYEIYDTVIGDGYTMYSVNMTSQRWMDDSVVVAEDTVWRHWMAIVVPDNAQITDAAMLYVHGDNKNADPPLPEDSIPSRLITFALKTGTVAASVNNIPHQPTTFADDSLPRTEDQIIARTWRYYIEGIVNNTDVILLLPMARAARRAVDTLISVTAETTDNINIEKVMPAGRSKRGWTSWLLGCTDQRVFAMAPIVLDLLNWHPNLHHHYQAYGGWSWAFQPYWAEGVSKYINNSKSFEIFDEVAIDPIAYNVRLEALPKMMPTAAGDEFFLIDDSHYFFEDLLGIKFMQILENTDHGLSGQLDRLWNNMANFFLNSYTDPSVFPDMSWVRTDDPDSGVGSLTLTINSGDVRYVRGWMADTTNVTVEQDDDGNDIHRRDFRLRTLTTNNPIVWEETAVQADDNTYLLQFDYRDAGYKGFFMEVSFRGLDPDDEDADLNFTTEVHIIPDTLPWDKCATEDECRGQLK